MNKKLKCTFIGKQKIKVYGIALDEHGNNPKRVYNGKILYYKKTRNYLFIPSFLFRWVYTIRQETLISIGNKLKELNIELRKK